MQNRRQKKEGNISGHEENATDDLYFRTEGVLFIIISFCALARENFLFNKSGPCQKFVEEACPNQTSAHLLRLLVANRLE